MGYSETQVANETRVRLLETARTLILRGEAKFSVATLCRQANIDRGQFRAHFSGKTALMAALMQEQASQPSPVAAITTVQSLPEAQIPKVEQEPSVSTPDAWLERRLRVFERALTALEAKAEANAREQARIIDRLEQRLAALSGNGAIQSVEAEPAPSAINQAGPEENSTIDRVMLAPETNVENGTTTANDTKSKGEPIIIPPLPLTCISKEEMAEVLQSARDKARAAAAAKQEAQVPLEKNVRMRWLAVGALSLVALFVCIGLTLGSTANATQGGRMASWQGVGVSHRHLVHGALARTIASADFGNAKAEVRLALAYLRGQGVARDASAALRWSKIAAQSGEPTAQYLLGAIYQQGEVVKVNPAIAFAWFAKAADQGNLRAMHNVAIAYAQGLGIQKDETKAAEWFARAAERGYVDSAFDLAVMYERGAGVAQDPRQALKWYTIAARIGDQPSRARADILRSEMSADDVKVATDSARQFRPLPVLSSANAI